MIVTSVEAVMKRYLISICAALIVFILVSCGSNSEPAATTVTPSPTPIETPSPTPSPTVVLPAKISLSAAKTILDTDKTAVFVDVRDKTDYDKEHIPGAISIPFEEFQDQYSEIPLRPQIIIYSGCYG